MCLFEILLFPTLRSRHKSADTITVRFAAGETAMFNFQVIIWSLFGVLLIAYIAVKMSKRKGKQA
jgi:hypothetical protein